MRNKIHPNSTVTRILGTVILGIVFVALAVSVIVINLSKDIYIDTYGKSQERVFQQVEWDLNEYHEKLMKASAVLDSSWALRLYLEEGEMDSSLSFQIVYQMQRDFDQVLGDDNTSSVLVAGMNNKSYINRAEKLISSLDDIFALEISKRAVENPDTIQYQFMTSGFTTTSRDGSVLIGAKALSYLESKEVYGIIYFIIREGELEDFYNYFVGDTTDFFIADQNNIVVSSNKKQMVGKKLEEKWAKTFRQGHFRSSYKENGDVYSILKSELPYYGFRIFGVIDNAKALDNQYNIPQMVVICAAIAFVVLVLVFFIANQITRPLSDMAGKMSRIREGDFSEYMEVRGTDEIRELATTYNYMLDGLKRYVDVLLRTQEEKRRSEIKALQMQINPHYIYNTLASIKWLIWQGDAGKSTQTIDAFIKLLRNTISNTNEFITLSQEIENLKNYIWINNVRYGNKVQVAFQIHSECEACLLPKLIMQPFIENAFFHAFPCEREGNIWVRAKISEKNLELEISDDGIGMNKGRLQSLTDKHDKSEHFSGIGINNVDDRLKLLYGSNYGVNIVSQEDKGTTVSIELPARYLEE